MKSGKVIVGTCGGDTVIDKVIKDFSDAEKLNSTHIFGVVFNSTLESRGVKDPHDPYPGVWLHDPGKYANDPTAKFYEVEVPDIEALEEKAREKIGDLYSLGSCISFWLHKSLKFLSKYLKFHYPDFSFSENCCELWLILLREGKIKILPKYKDNEISPKIMTQWLIVHAKDVTKEYRAKFGGQG